MTGKFLQDKLQSLCTSCFPQLELGDVQMWILTQTINYTKYHSNFSIFHPCTNHTEEKIK